MAIISGAFLCRTRVSCFFRVAHCGLAAYGSTTWHLTPAEVVLVHVEITSLSKLDGLVSPFQLCAFQRKLLTMLEGSVKLFAASRLMHSGERELSYTSKGDSPSFGELGAGTGRSKVCSSSGP